jgi:hypothetical protein
VAALARGLVVALACAALPVTAAAQMRGMPVYNSGFGIGAGAALDAGFANDAAGGGTTLGASASAGLGFIGVTAGVSVGKVNDKTVWSPGVAASLRLFGGPLLPFRVTLQAGAAQWSEGVVTSMHVPVSLGLAANIPIPGIAIRPWIAPRFDYVTTSFENSDVSATELGMSGGIEVGMLSGITVRAAYDRLFVDGNPGILSLGVAMSLGR